MINQHTDSVLKRSVYACFVLRNDWPPIKPLNASPAEAPDIDPDLLPEVLRDYVVDTANRMGVPKIAIAMPLLVSAGTVAGNLFQAYPMAHAEDWFETPQLWGMTVGEPSTKKTPSLNAGLRFIKDLRAREREAFKADEATSAAKLARLEAQHGTQLKAVEQAEKGSNSDALQKAQDRLAEIEAERKQIQIYPPELLTNDVTQEKLAILMERNPLGLLLDVDELAGLLRKMTAVGHENDRTFFMKSFNPRAPHVVHRVGRPDIDVDPATLSIVGGIQPSVLLPFMEREQRDGGDGFFARVQLPVILNANQVTRGPDQPADSAAVQRVAAAFQALRQTALAHVQEHGYGSPIGYHFDPAAQAHMDAWAIGMEDRSRSPQVAKFPAYAVHLGKSVAASVRLALLYHLIESAEGGTPGTAITLREAARATAAMDLFRQHARRLYGVGTSPELTRAQYLLTKIDDGTLQHEMSLREIQQRSKGGGISSTKELQAALGVLEEHGYVRVVEQPNSGTRSSTIVLLNPGLRSLAVADFVVPARLN